MKRSFFKTFSVIFLVMVSSLFAVSTVAQHRQRQQFHSYKKQNKRYKKACKIFARQRYREYMRLLANMNHKPKPRAEVDTREWSAVRNYRSRQVKYTSGTLAALLNK